MAHDPLALFAAKVALVEGEGDVAVGAVDDELHEGQKM